MPLPSAFLNIVILVAGQVLLYVVVVVEGPHLLELVVDVRKTRFWGKGFDFL